MYRFTPGWVLHFLLYQTCEFFNSYFSRTNYSPRVSCRVPFAAVCSAQKNTFAGREMVKDKLLQTCHNKVKTKHRRTTPDKFSPAETIQAASIFSISIRALD